MELSRAIKKIKEFRDIGEGETRIADLPEEFVKRYNEISDLQMDLANLESKKSRLTRKLEAVITLFWDDILSEVERADQADRQGLSTGIRKDEDGIPCLVSFETDGSDGLKAVARLFKDLGGEDLL